MSDCIELSSFYTSDCLTCHNGQCLTSISRWPPSWSWHHWPPLRFSQARRHGHDLVMWSLCRHLSLGLLVRHAHLRAVKTQLPEKCCGSKWIPWFIGRPLLTTQILPSVQAWFETVSHSLTFVDFVAVVENWALVLGWFQIWHEQQHMGIPVCNTQGKSVIHVNKHFFSFYTCNRNMNFKHIISNNKLLNNVEQIMGAISRWAGQQSTSRRFKEPLPKSQLLMACSLMRQVYDMP